METRVIKWRAPLQRLTIAVVADVQLGAPGCWEKGFRAFISEAKARNAHYLGLGDMVDVASPSNRRRLQAADLYDSVEDLLEEGARNALARLLSILAGTEGRWLGVLAGHHYYEFRDGTTTDMRLAEALKAPFLGTSAFLRIHFASNGRHKGPRCAVDIVAHHGHGWGQKQVSPLRKLEDVAGYWDADAVVIAHYHRLGAIPIPRLRLNRQGHLEHRNRWLVAAGSWLRGYQEGVRWGHRPQGSYAEQRFYAPTTLGGVFLHITPRLSAGIAHPDISVEFFTP